MFRWLKNGLVDSLYAVLFTILKEIFFVCFAFRATRLRIRYSVEDMERVMFDYDTDWTAHSLVVN